MTSNSVSSTQHKQQSVRHKNYNSKTLFFSVLYGRVVASTQSFKYQYKYQYLSLKYQYQYPCLKYKYQYFSSKYQYHCTSTCRQYHAAASYRLVQNLKSTTKHNVTYSRIYNNALQLIICTKSERGPSIHHFVNEFVPN